MKKKIGITAAILLVVLILTGCGAVEKGDAYCSKCGHKVCSSGNFCRYCGASLNDCIQEQPEPKPSPEEPLEKPAWSSWSKEYPPAWANEIETDYAISGYNMVLYVTQRAKGTHTRVFRSYSINDDYEGFDARKSYGEYHYTKFVTASELQSAKAYHEGIMIENGYRGYQAGNGTAYYFGNDTRDYVWFVESEVYQTYYRYR